MKLKMSRLSLSSKIHIKGERNTFHKRQAEKKQEEENRLENP
jgi:hypothetical protein